MALRTSSGYIWCATLVLCCIPQLQANEDTSPAKQRLSWFQLSQAIDRHIDAKLEKASVHAAPVSDDAEFLRRVYLDLAGRIPHTSEVRSFLADKSANKREKEIEKLITTPIHARHQTNIWQQVMLPDSSDLRAMNFRSSFQQWLLQKVRDNTPYNKLVEELLTPEMPNYTPGQVQQPRTYDPGIQAFYQALEMKPENVAAATSRIFLGIKLDCAQCHDHPFADWTRDQFWQYTAFFNDLPARPGVGNQNAKRDPFGMINIPNTKRMVAATYLTGEAANLEDSKQTLRVKLSNWMTSEKNPYFARTAVNRVWAQFFGIGIIDPVDDEPSTENPASHPELLKLLSEQFVANNYDIQYLLRAIANSRAYQRTSEQTDEGQADLRLFAKMSVRALTPDQLFESVSVATGFRESTPGGVARVRFLQNSKRNTFLNQFDYTDRPTEGTTSILQALKLMNGELIGEATDVEKSQTLTAVLKAPFLDDEERLNTLYLATLSRFPSTEEAARLLNYIGKRQEADQRQRAFADVFWALLNSSEFILNH